MWVNFGLGWLKCYTFSIMQALMQYVLCFDLWVIRMVFGW